MKIAFFEVEDWEKEHYRKAFSKHQVLFFKGELSGKDMKKIRDADVLSVFIYSRVDKETLDKLEKLKLITTRSTGFDHIDTEECRKRNITVCNVPTYGENTVAEHTFALILGISRKIPESIEKTRRGDFRLDGLRGFDLKGRIIGIVGCGNIGQHVARIAKGFEMDVLVFDVKRDQKLAKKTGFKYTSLEYLMKKSDIISLHAPENEHTHHMIDAKAFKMCKKGVTLINTSRGGLVDTSALIKALNDGTVHYAGLDVLEGECYIKEERELLNLANFPKNCDLRNVLEDNVLLRKDNVLVTPHNAFNSREALVRILDTTVENIRWHISGKKKNVVN